MILGQAAGVDNHTYQASLNSDPSLTVDVMATAIAGPTRFVVLEQPTPASVDGPMSLTLRAVDAFFNTATLDNTTSLTLLVDGSAVFDDRATGGQSTVVTVASGLATVA